MMVAAKTLALSAVELLENPELVKQARAAFDMKMAGQKYRSMIPENKRPALPAAQ